MKDVSERYELSSVEINALSIERTFIDKIMAIKRHAYCNNLIIKARHIYDVVKLYKMDEIKSLLENKNLLKDIVRKTKDTDNYYLEKRICSEDYNPEEKYDFGSWKEIVNRVEIRKAYERLHIDLLYTNEKQNFNLALNTLEEISKILDSIGE